MIPAFGLHLGIARGNLAAAAVTSLLIGNPITHTLTLPVDCAPGRWPRPQATTPGMAGGLPAWLTCAELAIASQSW